MSEPRSRTQHWTPNPDPTSIVVPGVDTTSSVNDQIDQIDQLITIRLQNIDANFSRIQHLIAAKLLPAFKRYAEGTEPVREAAKFWKSFYEAAAQVRIPIASDTSQYHTEEDSEEPDTSLESAHGADKTPTNINAQEDSFVRGAPISSTPLTRDPTNINLTEDSEDDDSWAVSIESPFERLGRQVRDLTLEENRPLEDYPSTSSAPSFSPLHGSYPGALPGHQTIQTSRPPKTDTLASPEAQIPRSRRKGKSPLRQNVLRQNAALAAASDGTSTPSTHTPRRNKTPKNPFLPPHSNSRHWNGLVDLRQPSPARTRVPRTPELSRNVGNGNDSDSSDDLFPPGMSPPVTMQFAMASRARASPAKLALTPARKAAERIGRDFIANAAGRSIGTTQRLRSPTKPTRSEPSISSVAPSLPSLTRYSGRPARDSVLPATSGSTLEPRPLEGKFVTPEHQIYQARAGPHATETISDRLVSRSSLPYQVPNPRLLAVNEAIAPSSGSDSDSDSSEHDESNPSAGFLFATQNNARAQANDSFSSSQQSLSSDEDDDEAARAARHPLAHIFVGGTQGVEDSFEQDVSFAQGEEETVFGARQVGQRGDGRLIIMRDALIDDTYTGAVSLNPFAQVEQSPTPYAGEAEGLH